MSDERATFEATRARLDDILLQVRKKDTSLEQSLELLEEGVRLANRCNELIDQTSWRTAEGDGELERTDDVEASDDRAAQGSGDAVPGSMDVLGGDTAPPAPPEDDERS
jgi:exodeoxyribonuclease VII small subunit